ncbi:MAG TPA: mannosyltransferase family protein [Gaiellaceae bacterium]|nr:mannosyltransferase family protein [Gaiellaceae bacterium]
MQALLRSRALAIFAWSRAAVWLAAIWALLWFEPKPAPLRARLDVPQFHGLGYGIDVWAHWDSGWFLAIAQHGYASNRGTAAFYPLYPGLVGIGGRILGGHYLLAGVLISLACCAASFVLLWRLAEPKLGEEGARRAVLYLALFPMSLFLQAVYAESLFLALALATFVLAERGRFAWASAACGLALLTRPVGVALVLALAWLAWRSRDRLRNLASLLLVPLLFVAYPLLLQQQIHDWSAFLHTESLWHRTLAPAGPFGGIWDGLHAGWEGIRQLAGGSGAHLVRPAEGSDALHTASVNVENLGFLLLFLWLAWLAWRRLGAAYGIYAAASLAIALSLPLEAYPLLSLPRFGLVIFPFFLALALVGRTPRRHAAILGASAAFLGVAVTQWALWQWVA